MSSEDKVTLKERTARGLLWSAFNNGTSQLLNVVIGVFLARLLSPDDYGLVGLLAIFTAIAGNLQSSGFSTYIINMKRPEAKDYNAVFWFNVFAGATLYALLFACAPLIAGYFHQPRLTPLARVIFIAFLVSSFGIAHGAFMTRNMLNREIAVTNISALVASGAIGIMLALKGYSYWSLAWQQIVYIAVTNIGRYYYTFKRWHPTLQIDLRPIKKMISFSMKILVTTIINTVSNNVLTFIFGKLFPLKAVGNFTQAYKWDTMAYSFVSETVNQVAQPVLVRVSDEYGRERRVFRKMLRFTAFMSFPLMLGLALVSHEFIAVLLGPKWAESAVLLQILCIGGAFFPLQTLYQKVALSHQRSDIYMWVNIAQIVLQIIIILLLHTHGIVALVCAYSAFNVLWLGVWHAFTARLATVSVRYALRDTLPSFFIAAVTMLTTHFVTMDIASNALLLATRAALAIAIFVALAKLFKLEMLDECWEYFKLRLKK